MHLTRHPVPTAISWLKLNAYVPPILPHMTTKELFNPNHSKAKLSEYKNFWQELSPIEKCFYFWGEVNLHALELKQNIPTQNWLEVQFESLFEDSTLRQLHAFLNLDTNQKIDNSITEAAQ